MERNNKGFTLTEILIVLVVAGILLALILPNALKAIERGNVAQVRSDLHSIDVALFMCRTQKGSWTGCESIDDLTTAQNGSAPFLAVAPKHPFGGTYSVKQNPNNVDGNVACTEGGNNVPADLTDDETIIKC